MDRSTQNCGSILKVDDFTHSNGTSLTSHVLLLLLLSGLCDSSMDVTARRHSTLRCALDNADDCTRSPRSILVDLASMRMRGAHMRGTLSKLCAYQDASLMHADSLWHPPRFSRIQRVGSRKVSGVLCTMRKVTFSRHCGLYTHHFRPLRSPRVSPEAVAQ